MASGWSRTIAALGGEVLVWGSIVFSLLVGSFYGLLLLPAGMFALALMVNRIFPLVAIDGRLTKARQRAVKGFWLAVAVLAVVVVARQLL